jgi:hypothetical protein
VKENSDLVVQQKSNTNIVKDERQIVILFNQIKNDGTGDYAHFKDIYLKISNDPNMKNYQIIPVILNEWVKGSKVYKRIQNSVELLQAPIYYYGDRNEYNDQYSKDGKLLQLISSAQEYILISYDSSLMKMFEKYFSYRATLKYIFEHECNGSYCYKLDWPSRRDDINIVDRSLGLADRRLGMKIEHYGIKINDIAKLPADEAFKIIEKNDEDFARSLLTHSKSTINDFQNNNIMIPAYFPDATGLSALLLLLCINEHLPSDKNIVIYLSMPEETKYDVKENLFDQYDKFSRVKIIKANNEPIILNKNANYSRELIIVYGLYVSQASYDALYQLAYMVGVGGDNTFERSVSYNLFPFYYPTNMKKNDTIDYIRRLSMSKDIGLTQYIQKELWHYFKPNNFFKDSTKIRLPDLIAAWPKIAAYLKQHCNFYDRLPLILAENRTLSSTTAPQLTPIQSNSLNKNVTSSVNLLNARITFSSQNTTYLASPDSSAVPVDTTMANSVNKI